MSRDSAAGRKPFRAHDEMKVDSAAGRKPFWAPEGI